MNGTIQINSNRLDTVGGFFSGERYWVRKSTDSTGYQEYGPWALNAYRYSGSPNPANFYFNFNFRNTLPSTQATPSSFTISVSYNQDDRYLGVEFFSSCRFGFTLHGWLTSIFCPVNMYNAYGYYTATL